MDKKKLIILSSLVLVLIIIIVLIFISSNDNKTELKKEYAPAFLNDAQKEEFNLNPETKAQVFYDEEGKIIYKIIRKEEDIVLNPENF